MARRAKISGTSTQRVRIVYSELGRTATAKVLGVRPSRLDRWLAGGGTQTRTEQQRIRRASQHSSNLGNIYYRMRLGSKPTYRKLASGRRIKSGTRPVNEHEVARALRKAFDAFGTPSRRRKGKFKASKKVRGRFAQAMGEGGLDDADVIAFYRRQFEGFTPGPAD